GDIGARNQKDHADGTHQDPQDAPDITNDVACEGTDGWADMCVLEELHAEARRSGKGSHNNRKHARNVGVDLYEGDAGLEPGESVVTEIPQVGFIAVKLKGNKNGWIILIQEMKPLRQDANNLPALAVHNDIAADDGGVTAKFAPPIAVSEHDGFGSAWRIILFGKGAAENGNNAEERKSAVGDTQAGHLFGLRNACNAHGVIRVKTDVLQGAVLFAEDEVVGGRQLEVIEVLDACCGKPDADQFIGFGIGQGLQKNAFENAENSGIGA